MSHTNSGKDHLHVDIKTLRMVLSKMFGTNIESATYQEKQLHGGTLGNVRLISGIAEVEDDNPLPYCLVLKVQRKWRRYADPESWRREYDLYTSDLGSLFMDSFRWPKCYHAELNGDETQLWMEYVEGDTGLDMTVEMYEQAAFELGRFQGRLYTENSTPLQKLTNLSQVDFVKKNYLHYKSWHEVYDYIRSDNCDIPKHLCKMLIDLDENADDIWGGIEKLPVVFCHRDYWITNIFYHNSKIRVIDWDTTGWGYMGEDIASLIIDESKVDHMVDYYHKCIPAYIKGFSEYSDVSTISNHLIYELILVMFGYRLVEWYKFADSPEGKELQLTTLQKIYEMSNKFFVGDI